MGVPMDFCESVNRSSPPRAEFGCVYQRLQIFISFDSVIQLFIVPIRYINKTYLMKIIRRVQKDLSTRMFTTELFMSLENGRYAKCPTAEGLVKYVIHRYIHR